ncbi:MAG TPA: PAS domain-containing protein [Longimicrobium sp.]|nr:PAS domain-containing protein [Longimicrobium sp.]
MTTQTEVSAPGAHPNDPRWPHGSETAERDAALERGRARRTGSAEGAEMDARRDDLRRTNPALAALAENVRDYAIFLMDPAGVITYWGEGAHLMKWWTREDVEGTHLRALYPENGSEDGTAETHLCQAAERGEYVGEGHRVRRDNSTFWAHVTLTALRDPDGELMGFCKLSRDQSARRTAGAALAAAHRAETAREEAVEHARDADAARERAEESAEFEREHARGTREYMSDVLEPELAAERAARADEAADCAEEKEERENPPVAGAAGPEARHDQRTAAPGRPAEDAASAGLRDTR